MNMLETWRPVIDILGWALIHFTWQGTLVALLLAGVLRLLQGASTNARYAAACAAILFMLALPVATLTHHQAFPRQAEQPSALRHLYCAAQHDIGATGRSR